MKVEISIVLLDSALRSLRSLKEYKHHRATVYYVVENPGVYAHKITTRFVPQYNDLSHEAPRLSNTLVKKDFQHVPVSNWIYETQSPPNSAV